MAPAACCPLGLQRLGAGHGFAIAPHWIGLRHRQLHEQRGDPVSQREVLTRDADVHRDHRSQSPCRQWLAAGLKQRPQPARGDGQHDVVDRAAERVLDLLQVRQRDAHDLETAPGADRPVEARVRRRAQLLVHDQGERRSRAAQRLTRVKRAMGSRLGRVEDRFDRQQPRPRVRQRSQRAGGGRVGGRASGAAHRKRKARGRHCAPLAEDGEDRAAGGASGVASSIRWPMSIEPTPSTMQWCVLVASAQRPSASPSTSAISHSGRWRSRRCGEEARCPLRQLLITPGGGECRAGDVPVDVKRGIVLPLRPRQPARVRLRQALSVARQLSQPAGKVLAQLLARRRATVRPRIEDHDHADVHVRALVGLLELEERRVQGCQVLAHGEDGKPTSGSLPTSDKSPDLGLGQRGGQLDRESIQPNYHAAFPSG